MIIQTTRAGLSGPAAIDGATLVSRVDPAGADRSDGVQPPTDLAVGAESLVARNLEVHSPTSGRARHATPLPTGTELIDPLWGASAGAACGRRGARC